MRLQYIILNIKEQFCPNAKVPLLVIYYEIHARLLVALLA